MYHEGEGYSVFSQSTKAVNTIKFRMHQAETIWEILESYKGNWIFIFVYVYVCIKDNNFLLFYKIKGNLIFW